MKILFMDVDGVLNNRTTPQYHTELYPLDPFMILLIDRIIQATGCKVVLSSAWRNHPQGVEAIKKVIPLMDTTPDFSNVRGEEIKAWLNSEDFEIDVPVEKYAILDDNNDFLPEQQENFFKTSWEFGLTEEIAGKVIQHLNA